MPGLKTSQKNQILKLAQAARLDPTKLEWERLPSRVPLDPFIARLVYKGSKYFFELAVDTKYSAFLCIYSPGVALLEESKSLPLVWERCLTEWAEWFERLDAEIHEPDLWDRVEAYRQQTDPDLAARLENTPLSVAEAQQVGDAIRNWQCQVLVELKLNREQLAVINDRLTELEEASRRLGKKDFLTLALGQVMNISMTAGIPPNVAGDLWRTLQVHIAGALSLLKAG